MQSRSNALNAKERAGLSLRHRSVKYTLYLSFLISFLQELGQHRVSAQRTGCSDCDGTGETIREKDRYVMMTSIIF